MNILLNDYLETTILNIDGEDYIYSTDYRLYVWYYSLLNKSSIDSMFVFLSSVNLPISTKSLSALNELYFKNAEDKSKPTVVSDSNSVQYDFDVLDGLIYSAFLKNYGIDLTKCNLHFNLFNKLLQNVKGTNLNDVISAWQTNIQKVKSNEHKKSINAIRSQFPLKINQRTIKTKHDRDKELLDHINRRYAEIEQKGG